MQLVKDLGFDGLDIDWEYPANTEEAANYVELLKAVREALDGYCVDTGTEYRFLLTAASPAGPQHYGALDLYEMDQYLDFWNLSKHLHPPAHSHLLTYDQWHMTTPAPGITSPPTPQTSTLPLSTPRPRPSPPLAP